MFPSLKKKYVKLSVRDGKIRGTKTHYLKGNQLHDIDSLLQSLIFSYYQNSFSFPKKIIFNIKPVNLSLIKQAIKLKFGKQISISTSINSDIRKVAKLAKLNANQVIDNRVNQSDRYLHAFKDLMSYLGSEFKYPSVEGFDVSHHGGKDAVASAVNFSVQGPEKSKYRAFLIYPLTLSGNDVGSLQHILEGALIKQMLIHCQILFLLTEANYSLMQHQQFSLKKLKKPPIILSIVKGSKRVRATETILSKNGILEMPKDSQDLFCCNRFEMNPIDLRL